jgi:hypothetical protein
MPITAFLVKLWLLMLVWFFLFTWITGAPWAWLSTAIVWLAVAALPIAVLEALGALRGLARLLFRRG